MSLLKTSVFFDKVKVVTADDYGPLHLHLFDDTSEDSTTDVDRPGEWTFLVYVVTGNSL